MLGRAIQRLFDRLNSHIVAANILLGLITATALLLWIISIHDMKGMY